MVMKIWPLHKTNTNNNHHITMKNTGHFRQKSPSPQAEQNSLEQNQTSQPVTSANIIANVISNEMAGHYSGQRYTNLN